MQLLSLTLLYCRLDWIDHLIPCVWCAVKHVLYVRALYVIGCENVLVSVHNLNSTYYRNS